MSQKNNPYHLWLGLPADLSSPNFFQLLGIAPDTTDNKQIAASARTNAQRLLDRLKKVPIKSDGQKAIRDKLKARIVKAHKTISDPAKRKQYIDALSHKHSTSSILPTVESPTSPVASPPKPSPPSSSAPANVPQAIPLAMPLENPQQQVDAASSNNDQFADLVDEDTVRVRPVRARGKRSSVVPIVVTLLIITVIGGLVSLLAKYNNVFDVLAKRDQNTVAPTVLATPAENSNADTSATPQPLKVPKSFEELAAAQSRNEQGSPADKKTTQPPADQPNESRMANSNGQDENTASNRESPTTNAREVSTADRAANASVSRLAANMVHAALVRRDVPAARIANQRITRLANANFLDAETRSLLKKQGSQNDHMITHLDEFLNQLRSAAEELPGGQDIKVGGLVMALVDASPTEITLRRAGRNEVIPYTDLPTSVALVLGDQGSKKSVPKWNMAKAADIIIQSQYTPSLRENAQPFLAQSISDGYDIECQAITDYSDTSWQRRQLPEKRPSAPTAEEVSTRLKEFRDANGYKNPELVKPAMASELIEKLLFSPTTKLESRLARLSDAIAIAARQKNFDALLVATDELYKNSNPINVADSVVAPINRCMRTDMTASEARHLVHAIIEMVRKHGARRNFKTDAKPELLRHAQTMVEEFTFSELAPKVKQLVK